MDDVIMFRIENLKTSLQQAMSDFSEIVDDVDNIATLLPSNKNVDAALMEDLLQRIELTERLTEDISRLTSCLRRNLRAVSLVTDCHDYRDRPVMSLVKTDVICLSRDTLDALMSRALETSLERHGVERQRFELEINSSKVCGRKKKRTRSVGVGTETRTQTFRTSTHRNTEWTKKRNHALLGESKYRCNSDPGIMMQRILNLQERVSSWIESVEQIDISIDDCIASSRICSSKKP